MSSNPSQVRRPSRRRRRALWTLCIAAVATAAIYFIAPLALTPLVTRKVQAMVSDHLHARLDIGGLSYLFPFGVVVRDAKFVTDDSFGSMPLLSFKRIELSLAQLPFGKGPIVVRALSVDEPILHVVKLPDGTILGLNLPRRGAEAPRGDRRIKLSDLLQLRRFNLNSATVVFEDRSHPQAKPMEWRNLTARLKLNQASASRYGFELSADSEPVVRLNLHGSADVDAMTVEVTKLAMSAQVRRQDSTSPLPAQLQDLLRESGIEGLVRFEARGDIPLKNPAGGRFAASATLDQVTAHPPGQPWALDHLSVTVEARRGVMAARATASAPSTMNMSDRALATTLPEPTAGAAAASRPANDQIGIRIADLRASGVGAELNVPGAMGTIDQAARRWELARVAGSIRAEPSETRASATTLPATRQTVTRYLLGGSAEFSASAAGSFAQGDRKSFPAGWFAIKLDNLVIQPPKFPQPLENVSGALHVEDRTLVVDRVAARYGNDQLLISRANIPLADLNTRIEARDILAQANFAQPAPKYPAPVDGVMALLQPTGAFDLRGAVGFYRGRGRFEPDYALQIVPQRSGLTLSWRQLAVTNLEGQAGIAPGIVEATNLQGRLLGGEASLRGWLQPRQPANYQGNLSIQNVDLADLSRAFDLARSDGKPKLTGRARLRGRFNGDLAKGSDAMQRFAAHGFTHIDDGDLWSINVFDGIVTRMPIARSALTAGQAGAVFEIKDRRIHLKKMAVSSSALGVQGSGVVGFDGALELDLIAAPLGDWRERIKRTGIPLLSDAVGQLAGLLQKAVNSATANLLYQFRVRGTTSEPEFTTVPAPILTDNAAEVFGAMLRGIKADKLVELIGGKEE